MIIPINIPSSSVSAQTFPPQFAQYGTDEVVLIELQGSLDVEGEMANQLVGKLDLNNDTKKPTLLIGHHLLEGKLVNLARPLAVMHRTTSSSEETRGDAMQEDERADSAPEWNIVAVVKRKMVFAKRPMPIVGRVSATPDKMR